MEIGTTVWNYIEAKRFCQDNHPQKFQNVERQSKILFFIQKKYSLSSYHLPFLPLVGSRDNTGIIPTFLEFNGKEKRDETYIWTHDWPHGDMTCAVEGSV